MKRLTLLAVGLLAFSGVASAGEAAERGVGGDSCGNFLVAERSGDSVIYKSWAQGWMSGVNFMKLRRDKETVDIPDANSMTQYLVNYCTAHPLEDFDAAVIDLMAEVLKNGNHRPLK